MDTRSPGQSQPLRVLPPHMGAAQTDDSSFQIVLNITFWGRHTFYGNSFMGGDLAFLVKVMISSFLCLSSNEI